jgi:LysM repeat protein
MVVGRANFQPEQSDKAKPSDKAHEAPHVSEAAKQLHGDKTGKGNKIIQEHAAQKEKTAMAVLPQIKFTDSGHKNLTVVKEKSEGNGAKTHEKQQLTGRVQKPTDDDDMSDLMVKRPPAKLEAHHEAPKENKDTHTVKPGENLSTIAKEHLGPNASSAEIQKEVNAIAKLNHLENPNLIKPGEHLKLPHHEAPGENKNTHTVKPGENLTKIAQEHLGPNATAAQIRKEVSDIAKLNHLENPNLIKPGQYLKLPEHYKERGADHKGESHKDNSAEKKSSDAEHKDDHAKTGDKDRIELKAEVPKRDTRLDGQRTDTTKDHLQDKAKDQPRTRSADHLQDKAKDQPQTRSADHLQDKAKDQPQARSADHLQDKEKDQSPDKSRDQVKDAKAEQLEKPKDVHPAQDHAQEKANFENLLAKLPEGAQHDRMEALTKTFEARTPQMEDMYTKQFENQGKSPEVALKLAQDKAQSELAETYKHVSELLEQKSTVKDMTPELQRNIAEQVLRNAAIVNPSPIDQGQHMTCGLASEEGRTYNRSPAEAARLVSEAALTGKYHTTLSKTEVTIDPHSLVPGKGSEEAGNPPTANNRCLASQIFEVTAANVYFAANNQDVQYRQGDIDPNNASKFTDFGERLVKKSTGEPIMNKDGTIAHAAGDVITDRALIQIDNEISGAKSYPNWMIGNEHSPIPAASAQQMSQLIKDALDRGDGPIILRVHTSNPPFWEDSGAGLAGGAGGGKGGWHFVAVDGYTANGFNVDNSWGSKSDHAMTQEQLFHALNQHAGG